MEVKNAGAMLEWPLFRHLHFLLISQPAALFKSITKTIPVHFKCLCTAMNRNPFLRSPRLNKHRISIDGAERLLLQLVHVIILTEWLRQLFPKVPQKWLLLSSSWVNSICQNHLNGTCPKEISLTEWTVWWVLLERCLNTRCSLILIGSYKHHTWTNKRPQLLSVTKLSLLMKMIHISLPSAEIIVHPYPLRAGCTVFGFMMH